jgi:microcystin-dependent protein
MADFNTPQNTSLYSQVWNLMSSIITSVVTMFDGTTDTNIPDKAKRYNTSTDKFQKYSSSGGTWANLGFHTAIDNHIADTGLHSGVPTGAIMQFGGSSAPSGYLLANGVDVSRTTYAALFAVYGTTYGSGDGSTTFGLPNIKGRFPIGKGDAGITATLGATGGSFDHTHSVPNHAHAIATHSHTMGNHTHSVGAHQHPMSTHFHYVPGHGHSSSHANATIEITSSGSHLHDIPRRGAAGSSSGDNRVSMTNGVASTDTGGITVSNSTSNHAHPHANFSGVVGNGSLIGDSQFSTELGGNTLTDASSAFNSGAPSDNNTSTGGPTTTSTDGSSTTGQNNPPYIVFNYIIKT